MVSQSEIEGALSGQFDQIRRAPVAFLAAVLFVAALIVLGARAWYARALDLKDEALHAKDEQLKVKDDTIDFLREQLHLQESLSKNVGKAPALRKKIPSEARKVLDDKAVAILSADPSLKKTLLEAADHKLTVPIKVDGIKDPREIERIAAVRVLMDQGYLQMSGPVGDRQYSVIASTQVGSIKAAFESLPADVQVLFDARAFRPN
jgi:hypothetical protein